MKRRTLFTAIGGVGAAGVLAACGGDGGSGSARVLTVGMPNGALTENHNPFMPDSAGNKLGYRWLIYEPLAQVNLIAPDSDPTPWLSTEWAWNEDYTAVDLTIRTGVKWSDDEDLTADDVAFTFNLMKDNPALNGEALPFESVTAAGDVVTVTFSESQFINQGKVLGTMVLPQHVWSAMDDPATDINLNPIGSGPYTLKSWTTQVVTVVPNDKYWGGEPPVPEIRYTSYNDNNAQTTALANGDCQWSYVFIPDFQKIFIDKDPEHFHLWFPSGLGIHALWLNHTRKPFDNVALRRAVNLAIDRVMVHEIGESGLYPLVDNLTGIPRPAGDAFIAPEFQDATHQVDLDEAKRILEEADYTWDADGALLDPDGEPVTFVMQDPTGWSDYLASLAIIADNLSALGIEATVEAPEFDVWNDAKATGDFDAMLHWTATGVTPYEIFANCMDMAYYKELGEIANWNFGRFESEEATQALRDYASATDDETRAECMATLQRIMIEEVPVIPLVAGPIGAEYSTRHWTGWPSEEDPYAMPQPTQPSASQIVMNLKPA
ncbi:peptide/nickel transport system substrate-binding protein [Stackebrandtia albiflava]|uniref:Peptide/nickel transport system substrate-binding protein n=1 Tax=Stackebrandtia albiflava TaxID=406432 RepID=A0A562VEB3_9ACTN|nr:ABC transporter substrate-binding protein [Stackebrandtia albiflava]TWJ16157.1 peptide/nickel transport system substrate-binding protein [Stackebrandtia albiflava]